MKTNWLLLSVIAINIAAAQKVEKIDIPKGIVYNYGDTKLIDKAKSLISDNLSDNSNYSILGENVIVGPQLWKRFKNIEKLQKIKGNVTFHVDNQQLSGKMSQDLEDSKSIWDEFRKEITGKYTLRKANVEELKYYWSVISFDIDEPLLILETENHNYILNLLKSDLKLLWLDEAPRSKYQNPIDNKTYVAEGGFKTYQNGQEVTSTSIGLKETKLEKVILLSSDKELKENSSIEDLQLIITKTEAIFEELFKNSVSPGKIIVEFELKKKDNEIQFAVKDDLDLTIMKEFEARINSTQFPNSKNQPVKIQLVFKVNSFDDQQ